ncbi:MAG: branched-chain amino acid ABC transporter permease, partial [Thermodesulfobacteriota bacterium]|nr:branched-chain amino acid ABC transporter permease [Thermodesulfobacteriota bacterium]
MEYRKERIDRGIKARTNDIHALSGYAEIIYLVLPRFFPVAGLILLLMLLNEYGREVLINTCTITILALSWTYITSVGMISLGQALFF